MVIITNTYFGSSNFKGLHSTLLTDDFNRFVNFFSVANMTAKGNNLVPWPLHLVMIFPDNLDQSISQSSSSPPTVRSLK